MSRYQNHCSLDRGNVDFMGGFLTAKIPAHFPPTDSACRDLSIR